MSEHLTLSTSAQQGVAVAQRVHADVLKLLLARILPQLPQDSMSVECLFNVDEQSKLQKALSISSADAVSSLVLFCAEIFSHAGCHGLKTEDLQRVLGELGVTEAVISAAFAEVWAESGASFVERLRQQSTTVSELQSVTWTLNLEVSNSGAAKFNRPNADVCLAVGSHTGGVPGLTQQQRAVTIPMTHGELYAFYDTLEVIQRQLDALS